MTEDGEVTLIYEYLNIIQLLHPCSISLTQFQSPLSLSCGLDALRAEVSIRRKRLIHRGSGYYHIIHSM